MTASISPEAAAIESVLIANPRAGCSLRPGCLDELIAAAKASSPVHVHLMNAGEDIAKVVRDSIDRGAKVIAVAGGDGTISSVAQVLAGTDIALLPIPFGTLNHFAKDAGMVADPLQAIQALDATRAEETLIDVGKVNTRYFINNSSLGLYPHLVRRREKRQHELGKWMAYAVALFEYLRHPVCVRVQLAVEEGGRPFLAGLLFVANNAVEEGVEGLGKRIRLDAGFLQLYVLKEGSVWATFRAAVAFLRGRSQDSSVLNEHRLKAFTVLVKHQKRVRVSCDGETFVLHPPIKYEIVPQSLKVRILKSEAMPGQ